VTFAAPMLIEFENQELEKLELKKARRRKYLLM